MTSPDLMVLLLGDELGATSILDTLHDVIVDYPTAAVESETADMRQVMERVGVLNSLYIALRQLTSHSVEIDSLICK